MLPALLVGIGVLVISLVIFAWTTALIVRVVARFFRPGFGGMPIWKDAIVMMVVSLITMVGHLIQIALWAGVYLLVGDIATFETAFYASAQNYTALGYGDIVHSEQWRLLGPIEAINGLLLFGMSTGLMFAVMGRLITNRLHLERRNN